MIILVVGSSNINLVQKQTIMGIIMGTDLIGQDGGIKTRELIG